LNAEQMMQGKYAPMRIAFTKTISDVLARLSPQKTNSQNLFKYYKIKLRIKITAAEE